MADDKPSLTPHRDEVERMIGKAAEKTASARLGFDHQAVATRIGGATSDALLRAMADEKDAGTPMKLIYQACIVALRNQAGSVGFTFLPRELGMGQKATLVLADAIDQCALLEGTKQVVQGQTVKPAAGGRA